MTRYIPYKGIVHNVLNDAPFIGAILIARTCHYGCQNCINAHLKTDAKEIFDSAENIIDKVIENGLNEGVIFSGLEWTEQPKDLEILVERALEKRLKVMVYTHHTQRNFFKIMPSLKEKPIYVKFGGYQPEKATETHFSYDVKLASSNQYIIKNFPETKA